MTQFVKQYSPTLQVKSIEEWTVRIKPRFGTCAVHFKAVVFTCYAAILAKARSSQYANWVRIP